MIGLSANDSLSVGGKLRHYWNFWRIGGAWVIGRLKKLGGREAISHISK